MTTDATIRPHHYERWSGTLNTGRWTWLTIVATGLRLIWRDPRRQALLWTGLVFAVSIAGTLYALSLLEGLAGTEEAQGLYEFVKWFLKVDISGAAHLSNLRGVLWRAVFLVTIKGELFWVVIILAQCGPGVIANDLRSRALPIYFAKPVTAFTYVAGKWIILAALAGSVVMASNLVALLFAASLTGGLDTVWATVRLGGELAACGLVVCLLAGMTMAALSSLTPDRRYVAVMWLTICLLSAIAQTVVNQTLKVTQTGWLGCLSMMDNVMVLVNWLFDLREMWSAAALAPEAFKEALVRPVRPVCAGVVTAAEIAAATLICYWRVVKFSRSAASM